MNKNKNQNHKGIDFIFKSNYTDISKPAAPLLSMRNPAGFSFYPTSFNLSATPTNRSQLS